ncbi:reverse transcriptase domain-containing protein [Tanacetum coccineum]
MIRSRPRICELNSQLIDSKNANDKVNMPLLPSPEPTVSCLKGWSKKLNDALWAFRLAYKTPTRCTPFRLLYGKACHLPVEVERKAHWALKQCNMDLTLASEIRLMQLNELAELRDGAYKNTRIYKERTKKLHDSRLRGDKDFKVGDKDGFSFKVNGQRLKKYYGGDIDKEDDEVIELDNDAMRS